MKRHVYRPGDRVRLINPRIVRRVGYPLVWTDLVPGFLEHPQLDEAMRLLGLSDGLDNIRTHSTAVLRL